MAGKLDTLILFGSDSYGLERILRFFQAVSLVLTSYPEIIVVILQDTPEEVHLAAATTLFQLQSWFNVTRRLLRFFWFLKSFQSSWTMHMSHESKAIEDWLDVLTASTLGIFGILESATLPDVMGIDNVSIFGPEVAKNLNIQAQVFWFVALYASVVSCGIKLFRALAYRAVPSAEIDFDGDDDAEVEKKKDSEDKGEKKDGHVTKEALMKRSKKLQEREAAAKQARDKVSALTMKIIADALDMVLPAVICGWVEFHPGHVGIAMIISTYISTRLAWKRFALAAEKA